MIIHKDPFLPVIVSLAVILSVEGAVYLGHMKTQAPPVPTQGTQSPAENTKQPPLTNPVGKTYSMAEVKKHNSKSSCWTVIDSEVYDLTSWVSQHPGGPEAILGICGSDGTEAFRAQHGRARRQANILATFKIGTLAP